MATATFNPDAVAEAVQAEIRERSSAIHRDVDAEATNALAAVERYARHLAAGGDPTERPDRDLGGCAFVHPAEYLGAVYAAWNDARGSRNPFSPISSLGNWQLAEYALERVGQPMPFAEVQAHMRSVSPARYGGGWQSDDIARGLAALQGDDLVLRRVKVGGKVAYLLRERQEGDERAGRFSELNPLRVSLFAGDVPEEKWPAR